MSREGYRLASVSTMPSFDIVSEVDRQELRNAVDQAQREMVNRFDFKNTNSDIEQKELIITIRTISEEKARAVRVLLEEKFVKRGLSLKGIDWESVPIRLVKLTSSSRKKVRREFQAKRKASKFV